MQSGAQTLSISATAWEALLQKVAGSSSVRHNRPLMHCIGSHLRFVLILQGQLGQINRPPLGLPIYVLLGNLMKAVVFPQSVQRL